MVWISPVISMLKSSDPDINPLGTPITTVQLSLLACTPSFSLIITPFLMDRLADKLGRKQWMLLASLILISSLTVIAFVANIYVYYISRFVYGISRDLIMINTSIYGNEIAEKNKRGMFTLLSSLGYPFGIIYGYVFGSFTNFTTFTLICALPAVLHVLLNSLIVESPVYLALKRKRFESLLALEKLRTSSEDKDIELELTLITDDIKTNNTSSKPSLLSLFSTRLGRKGLFVSAVLTFTQKFSGIHFILPFLASSIDSAGISLSGNAMNIIIGVLLFIFFILTALVVEKIGKRPLILTSTFTCSISMLFMGIYFYLTDIQSSWVAHFRWFPIPCAVIFIVGYGMGLGCLILPSASELFSNELRVLGVSLCMGLSGLLVLFIMFTFPIISESVGLCYNLWFFSFICSIGFVILYFMFPETVGKNFHEIQEMLLR